MEDAIFDGNEIYRKAFELCPTGIVILDKEGKITYANYRVENILGLSKNEITQLTYNAPKWEITDLEGNIVPDAELPFAKAIETRKAIDNVQHAIKIPNGKHKFLSINAIPIFYKNGQINGVIATIEDITELIQTEKDLKASKDIYKNLFENLIDEVHLWRIIRDENKEIKTWELIDANPSALNSWGKSRNQVIGKSPNEIFNFDAVKQFMPIVKKIFDTGKPHSWDAYFEPTNQYLSMSSIPLKDSFISTGRDITEMKVAEKKLIDAKEKAEKANRLKSEFLKNMSHEIRTPLNGILGFSDLLNSADTSKEERKQYVEIVQNSGHQLLRIIEDILEISNLESQQESVNETEFNLNDLVTELFSIFELKSKENNVPIYLYKALQDEESKIITDRSKLYKILKNLLENAIKFTHHGFIKFGYEIKEEQLVFFVKDTGIGISPKNRDLIFERFSQEEKEFSKSTYGGLGLGLSISKENARLLGGDITVESTKGEGTTFYVSVLYKTLISKENDTSKIKPSMDTNKTKILVAEDEEINYMYIEVLFKKATDRNYELLRAKDGSEAVDICSTNNDIELVLMDIRMPVMNGHEATEKIKSRFPHLPVIAQTAYSTQQDRNLALKHGCDDFITKPLDREELFGLINKYLSV